MYMLYPLAPRGFVTHLELTWSVFTRGVYEEWGTAYIQYSVCRIDSLTTCVLIWARTRVLCLRWGPSVVSMINRLVSPPVEAENVRGFGQTSDGKPIDWYVEEQAATGTWREEEVAPQVSGLSRPIRIYRAARKTSMIAYDWHGDDQTFCPPMWWDLAIGSGACGLGCRSCFLMLTHRIRRDPMRHLLYDNVDDFARSAEQWIADSKRRRQHTLGLGIDRSDSLLYEGVLPHVHNLAPLFTSLEHNPNGNKLILLTKSVNTHYLVDVAPSL